MFDCSVLIDTVYTSGSHNFAPSYAPDTLLVFLCALAALVSYCTSDSARQPGFIKLRLYPRIGALPGSRV
jgi:hypothetical protein